MPRTKAAINIYHTDIHDKICSTVKKCQTMTEAHVVVKTTNSYFFIIYSAEGIQTTSDAQQQQVCQIWKMTNDLKEMGYTLTPDRLGKIKKRFINQLILSQCV